MDFTGIPRCLALGDLLRITELQVICSTAQRYQGLFRIYRDEIKTPVELEPLDVKRLVSSFAHQIPDWDSKCYWYPTLHTLEPVLNQCLSAKVPEVLSLIYQYIGNHSRHSLFAHIIDQGRSYWIGHRLICNNADKSKGRMTRIRRLN